MFPGLFNLSTHQGWASFGYALSAVCVLLVWGLGVAQAWTAMHTRGTLAYWPAYGLVTAVKWICVAYCGMGLLLALLETWMWLAP